jgi:hypothetical protein
VGDQLRATSNVSTAYPSACFDSHATLRISPLDTVADRLSIRRSVAIGSALAYFYSGSQLLSSEQSDEIVFIY